MSQDQLADAVGVQRTSVSNWERGVHEPTAGNLEDIGRAIGMTPDAIRKFADDLGRRAGAGGSVRERSEPYSPSRPPTRIPPAAYQLVYEYCRTLEAAGVDEEDVEEARRLMSDETFNTLRKGTVKFRTEEDWINDINAAWVFLRDRLRRGGYKL